MLSEATLRFIFYKKLAMLEDKDTIISRLICAIKLGRIEEVSSLINSFRLSSSVEWLNTKDDTGRTPLFYAACKGHLKMVKLLLTNGADNVKEDVELLNISVRNKFLKTADIFLQYGAVINATDVNGRTALHAIFEGRVRINRDNNIKRSKMVKFLLSSGADINARTLDGCNALHIAGKSGLVKVVETLLEYNADVNSRTRHSKHGCGKTALHIACGEGHHEVVEVLLKCGAKVDSRTELHMTPLHFAAEVPYPRVVKVLLQFGAGIDFTDTYGRTALHFAVNEGCTKNVVTLLRHGSDVNIQSKYVGTPLYYVTNKSISPNCEYYRGWRSRMKIIKILKRHMVKMKTANLYVNETDLLSIGNIASVCTGFPSLQNKCKEEIPNLKSLKINNTNVSFYDILTNHINRLALYARNKNIAQVLTSDDSKVKFQIYANIIEGNFRKGKMRNELLEASSRCFPELPSICNEEIFMYLSNEELLVLIEAYKKQTRSAD